MADLSALEAELADVKSSSQAAFDAVLAQVDGLKGQMAGLEAQIAELVAGQVSQEQIDALLATAEEADATIDAITEAATPLPSPEPPIA